MRTDLGLRVDNILTFSIASGLGQYTDQQAIFAHEQIRQRLASLPGVNSVSSADTPVIAGSRSGTSIQVDGFPNENEFGVKCYMSVVGTDYFRTLGTPLVMGREFGRQDNSGAPKVAIVNEGFVKKFFQGRDPLGRQLRRGDVDLLKVVGVVKDTKYASLKEPSPALFYTPLGQKTRRWSEVYFYLRTSVDPQTLMAVVRREVAAVDRNLPVLGVKTLEAQVEENTASERKLAALSGAFAALATVLAAIGLYGTLTYNVVRRTREIGIRMALGAGIRDVRQLMIFEVIVLLVGGTIVGLVAASATGRLMQGFLYEMNWWDPAVCLAAVVVLWIVGMWAAWVPTRRATAVDPMIALRWE